MRLNKPKFWDRPTISFWSIVLFPLSILYLFISLIIRFLKYEKKFSVPIVCIGNIYLGGTGKTPLASEIFKIIKSSGKNPGFIKKGYDYLYDEIKMLEKIGKTYSNKNRKDSINQLIASGHDVAILDDGYQDYSIKKDFSVLCFNSKQLVGNGFIFPSGPLRENISSIFRADCIVINGNKNSQFEEKISKIIRGKKINIFNSKYKIKNLEKLQNKEIVAFAGIGNPSNFFDLLKENNLNIKKTYSFPDHHHYSQKDLDSIIGDNRMKIVTTEKDYSRLNDKEKKYINCVEVTLEIENKNKFIDLIKSKI